MTMAELKPCPFCGGEVAIAQAGENSHIWWFITRGHGVDRCTCRVFMESEAFWINDDMELKQQFKQELIERWNRRADNG